MLKLFNRISVHFKPSREIIRPATHVLAVMQLVVCKPQTVPANRINVHFYRNAQLVKSLCIA